MGSRPAWATKQDPALMNKQTEEESVVSGSPQAEWREVGCMDGDGEAKTSAVLYKGHKRDGARGELNPNGWDVP